jgi:hypothetical protein
MTLIEKIKYFLISIDFSISKSFLFSQSRFSKILKDFIYTKLYLLRNNFTIILGKSDLNNFEIPQETIFHTDYSKCYLYKDCPEILKKIIKDHQNKIENYLGKNFLLEKVMYYETFNLPKILVKEDIYSNIWHMDSHDGNKLLKIFILLQDVEDNDGPFVYLDRLSTKKNWRKLVNRWTFDKKFVDYDYDEQNKFLGKKGDYLIIDTSICSHRASSPNESRKMLVIDLFPRWTKNNNRKKFEF